MVTITSLLDILKTIFCVNLSNHQFVYYFIIYMSYNDREEYDSLKSKLSS